MWKVKLAESLLAAHQKLASYYRNTDGLQGQIYNWATVLYPAQRLETYKTSNIDKKLLRAYKSDFRQQYKRYEHLERVATPKPTPRLVSVRMGFAALATLKQREHVRRATASHTSRLNDYLSAAAILERDILLYWVSQEQHSPGLAQIARDILAVLISSVGVERLFSTACQICCYTRNRLRPSTIGKMLNVKHAGGYISRREKRGIRHEVDEQADRSTGNNDNVEGDYKGAEKLVISNDEVEDEEEEEEKDDEEDEEEDDDMWYKQLH
jgi:hypothetical protein